MKKILFVGLMATCVTGAEEEGGIDLEARRQSVVTMRAHLESREKRLAEVGADLRERGDALDRRIGEIVNSLSQLKDSQSSKTRISQIKQEAAQGLMNMIEFYQRERRKLVERAKRDPKASIDGIAQDVELIDKRVEERAQQIVKLVQSVPGAKDVKKYESDGGYGGWGWRWENSRISDEWRQNRRDKSQSKKARDEAQKALEGAIADLERRRDSIRAKLDRDQLTHAEREIQSYELDHVEGLLKARKRQLVEVTMPSAEPGQKASKDEADDIKSLFDDARRNLSADFDENIRLYRLVVEERDKLHALRQNLEAREEWLKENDPDWKE